MTKGKRACKNVLELAQYAREVKAGAKEEACKAREDEKGAHKREKSP